MSSKSLHIALTFDDNFWAPAYAVMRSVCLFTLRRHDLVFHLFHRTLRADHRAVLEAIETEFGAEVMFYDLDASDVFSGIAPRLPQSERLPNIVFARLFVDRVLPSHVERVLYLDCDTLVRAPIEELLERDLEGFPIGAVRDTTGAHITSKRDLRNNRDLFDVADPYFNSGVILIDVARWRDANIVGRLEEALRSGVMARIYYDQDFLNLVFKNDWLRLEPRWNLIGARRAHEGLDPHILHYTGKSKPWGLLAGILRITAFARVYRHVMTNDVFYQYLRERWARYWLKKIGWRRSMSGKNGPQLSDPSPRQTEKA